MNNPQSPLLTHAVDYNWDELKEYAQSGFKSKPPVAKSAASQEAKSTPSYFQARPASATMTGAVRPIAPVKISADDPALIAAVAEAAKKELDLVIEMTLKNAESKIRNELQRHLVEVAKKAIEEALTQRAQQGR